MSLPVKKPNITLIYGALILSLVIWGGTSVVGKLTVSQFPVYSTLFLRFCLASLCLIPFYLFDHHRAALRKTPKRKIHWLILLSFVGISLQIGLFFIGITQASVMDANIISALVPLLIAACGWVLLKEKFQASALIGMTIATVGVTVALTSNTVQTHHSWWGNLAIFGSVISSVVYAIGSKKLAHDFCPLAITTTSFLVGMLSFAPLAAWEYISTPNLFSSFTSQTFWGIAYLGIISSVVAYWLYQWSLDYVSATDVGTFSFMQPLAGIILAMLVIGESLTWGYLIGGGLTLIGITLAFNHPQMRLDFIRSATRHRLGRNNLADRQLGLGPNASRAVVK